MLSIKTSKGERSDRKIINIDQLVRSSKKNKERPRDEPASESESKILGVYKKGRRQPMEQSTLI